MINHHTLNGRGSVTSTSSPARGAEIQITKPTRLSQKYFRVQHHELGFDFPLIVHWMEKEEKKIGGKKIQQVETETPRKAAFNSSSGKILPKSRDSFDEFA